MLQNAGVSGLIVNELEGIARDLHSSFTPKKQGFNAAKAGFYYPFLRTLFQNCF